MFIRSARPHADAQFLVNLLRWRPGRPKSARFRCARSQPAPIPNPSNPTALAADGLDRRDLAWAASLAFALTLLYLFLQKGVLTVDSGLYLIVFGDFSGGAYHLLAFHLLFGRGLWLLLGAGAAAGWSASAVGVLQAAALTALACSLLFLLLRRHGVTRGVSLISCLLFAFNGTIVENATSIEVYAGSAVAVILSLHAVRSFASRPGRGALLAIYLSCVLVLALHLGFAFWVFGLYLALAAAPGMTPRNRLGPIAWGAATLVPILAWLALEGFLSPLGGQTVTGFLRAFWRREGFGGAALSLFHAPLFGCAVFAGALLCFAGFGWRELTRRAPLEARILAIAAPIFFAYFAFWTIDDGSFYVPLLPLLTLASALGLERLLARMNPWRVAVMAAIYGTAFLLAGPRIEGYPMVAPGPANLGLAICFWGWFLVSMRLGPPRRPGLPGGQPFRPARVAIVAIPLLAINLAAYLPDALADRRPDEARARFEALNLAAPASARYVTQAERYRAMIRTRRESLSIVENPNDLIDWNQAAPMLSDWLRETAEPGAPPVFFDPLCYKRREDIWSERGLTPPLDEIEFTPVASGAFTFYRARMRAP